MPIAKPTLGNGNPAGAGPNRLDGVRKRFAKLIGRDSLCSDAAGKGCRAFEQMCDALPNFTQKIEIALRILMAVIIRDFAISRMRFAAEKPKATPLVFFIVGDGERRRRSDYC